jgi:hypothetical protein
VAEKNERKNPKLSIALVALWVAGVPVLTAWSMFAVTHGPVSIVWWIVGAYALFAVAGLGIHFWRVHEWNSEVTQAAVPVVCFVCKRVDRRDRMQIDVVGNYYCADHPPPEYR